MQCKKIDCVANYNGKCCTDVCKGELVKVIRFDDNLEQEDVIAAKSKFYEMMTKKMNKIELKPCPFCGYDKPFLMFCEYDQLKWTISCPKCSIEVTTPVLRDWVGGVRNGRRRSNKTNLIEKWNKRAEKTGKWIIKKDRFNSRYAVCSECGANNCAGNLKYCFDCGAKMESEEVNND